LTLWSGEWFENMRQSGMGVNANVPYRRETFSTKKILLDFDSGFNMAEMGEISTDARSKGLSRIVHDLDSIREFNDSVGHQNYREAQQLTFSRPPLLKDDSARVYKEVAGKSELFDSLYQKQSAEQKQRIVTQAMNDLQMTLNNMDYKAEWSYWLNRDERMHVMEAINKFTLSLSCIIFFFIGAPLGAIIRKGGLGVPVIISVIVFIVFYILDNTGMRMARIDEWTVWFGKLLGTAVLTPIAVFFTYKANKDSTVFNMDLYRSIAMRMLGLRTKRSIMSKEVVIEDPHYEDDSNRLTAISQQTANYMEQHKLLRWPNPIVVFFRPGDDQEIARINDELEATIEDLSYSRDKRVIALLNRYPVIATHAHTRPFQRKWLNVVTGLFLPTGIFFYCRMIRFRFRLYKDLQHILTNNRKLVARIGELLEKR
jgi:lipopolysaccharide export system permease protein